ncbi:MAG: aminotransferase class V-fold PLP-dependent enzyme [Rikenellaceae bacterium]
MNKPIYLCLAHMGGDEQKYIQEAFDTNWVVPLGPNVNGFEQDLQDYLGEGKPVVALSSGTAALHLALIQAGVTRGDEVICQSFTFCASANPICYLGAQPVFVDSDKGSWNLSPELLKVAIEDRLAQTGKLPKAIIVVHLYGMPAKMDKISQVADNYGITIIEDAAEALGSTFNGQKCGNFGKFGVLSFNGNKMITTSGGGALVCSDDISKKQAMFYATQAREDFPYYQHEKIGYNYRMSNICAGIGRGQMNVLDEHVAHHHHVHELYKAAFADIEGISLMSNYDSKASSNYWLATILIDEKVTGFDYEQLRQKLSTQGIETRPLWKPLHLQPVFADAPSYVDGTSEALFNQGLCLPSGPCVSDQDVEFIINEIKKEL